ncbi:MAG: hypothetical protein RBR52_00250 [Thiomonas sp.]|uniref:hypothetical protein n=1 Tax=Thiomonas sp. TaxID=2047785 RepID=UPI002A36686F|nr:hypothetical protein [Thiomonas sp.]MDY0328909.1 hypothetical protein [Thiomonas sp.]
MSDPIPEKIRALVESAQSAEPMTDTPLSFVAGEDNLAEQVDACLNGLAALNPPTIFRRSTELVTVERAAAASPRSHYRGASGSLIVRPLDVPRLQTELARHFSFARRRKDGGMAPCNPPPGLAASLLSSGGGTLPVLTGVVPHPTHNHADGRTLDRPGYDPCTGLLLDFGRLKLPKIPERPTRAQGLDGLEQAAEVIAEFPFVSDVDKSVALAYVLTLLQRRMMDMAPLFLFTATSPATGKTLLATAWPRLVLGHDPAIQAFPQDDGELRKTLFAALADGQSALLLDNVNGRFKSDGLCIASTSATMRERVLGFSRTLEVPTTATIAITGNNAQPTGDVAQRVLPCSLDARVEHPENRAFLRDLLAWIEQERPRLLAALLTLLRAYAIASDKPTLKPWRFAEWSQAVRGPLVWAGYPDPLNALDATREDDPARVALAALLSAWHAHFGNRPQALRDVLGRALDRAAAGDFELRDAIAEVAGDRGGEMSAQRLGKYLQERAGRIVAGLAFKRGTMSAGAVRWIAEPCSDGGSGGSGGAFSSQAQEKTE